MKLTKFFKEQVDKWNCEKKCGQCFEFHAPLSNQALNKQQLKNSCCIQVFFTTYDVSSPFGNEITYNNRLGVVSEEWEYENFNIWFLIRVNLGVNDYNEILGHSEEESITNKLEDLKKCLKDDIKFNFCEYIGQDWAVTNWRFFLVPPHMFDNNFTGYRLTVTIRKRKK